MNNYKVTLGILFVVFFVLTTLSVAQARDLAGDEAKTLFSGKSVLAYHVRKDFEFVSYYNSNGSIKVLKKDETWPGVWRVDSKGLMCITLKDPYSGINKKEKCRVMVEDNGVYNKYKVKRNGERILLITYNKFFEGNYKGL